MTNVMVTGAGPSGVLALSVLWDLGAQIERVTSGAFGDRAAKIDRYRSNPSHTPAD